MLQIYHEMHSIASDFPDLASRVKIGHSFENRSIYVLKVRLRALQGARLNAGSWFLVSKTQLAASHHGQLFRTSWTSGRRLRWGDISPHSNLV